MVDESRAVLTIGHSNHPIEQFVSLLRAAGVTAVADVRSAPHSRYVPQFNHDALKVTLREAGIMQVYLGKELGGRPQNQAQVPEMASSTTTRSPPPICSSPDCSACWMVRRRIAWR